MHLSTKKIPSFTALVYHTSGYLAPCPSKIFIVGNNDKVKILNDSERNSEDKMKLRAICIHGARAQIATHINMYFMWMLSLKDNKNLNNDKKGTNCV